MSQFGVCPSCGAKRITSAAEPCWLCSERLPEVSQPVAGGPVEGRKKHPVLIGIALLVILLMVALAIETPGLLVVLAVAATPGLIRMVVVAKRDREAGQPLGAGEKVGVFLGTLGAVVMVGVAAGVAFFATCFAICLGMLAIDQSGRGAGNLILPVSVLAGIIPGLFVFVYMVRHFVRKARK